MPEQNEESVLGWEMNFYPRRGGKSDKPKFYRMEYFKFPIKAEVPGVLLAEVDEDSCWVYENKGYLCIGTAYESDGHIIIREKKYEYGSFINARERKWIEETIRRFMPIFLEAKRREREDQGRFAVEHIDF